MFVTKFGVERRMALASARSRTAAEPRAIERATRVAFALVTGLLFTDVCILPAALRETKQHTDR